MHRIVQALKYSPYASHVNSDFSRFDSTYPSHSQLTATGINLSKYPNRCSNHLFKPAVFLLVFILLLYHVFGTQYTVRAMHLQTD